MRRETTAATGARTGCGIGWPTHAAIGFAVITAVAACHPVLLFPDAEDAAQAARRWPGTTVEDLHEGRAWYAKRCSGCHALHLPDSQPAEAWSRIVEDMQANHEVELGERERELVIRYLAVVGRRPP
jgi:mono/diheme cytochrome c family protein